MKVQIRQHPQSVFSRRKRTCKCDLIFSTSVTLKQRSLASTRPSHWTPPIDTSTASKKKNALEG